jgi:hypothetical protein
MQGLLSRPSPPVIAPPPLPSVDDIKERFELIKVHRHINGVVMAEIIDKKENMRSMVSGFDPLAEAMITKIDVEQQEITISDQALKSAVLKARAQ